MNRRDFLKSSALAFAGLNFLNATRTSTASLSQSIPAAAPRPNVLLVILEDWGPYLGCYGHPEMKTPNLDRLAAEGVRFDNCFSCAPVCSVARSGLMTGMSQYSTYSEQHRVAEKEKRPLPAGVKSLPEVFREAGYYTALGCGQSSKIDLNFKFDAKAVFQGRDWRTRVPGQPFFAHLTLGATHRPWKGDSSSHVDPARVSLPAWYPDTPMTRKDWAMGLECAQRSDRLMGEILQRLKDEGLYDNTIIVITSDHGIALPRGKQFLYDEGLRIPLIIRGPKLTAAGSVRRDLASNLDIMPTVLAMAGIPIPAAVQGCDLLDDKMAPRQVVFAARDKMDDTHDAMRAVRSTNFKYIQNLMPERAWCQFNAYKERSYPGLALLNVLHMEGKLTPEQDAFMQPKKPAEELYDLRKDPFELHNVATDPEYASALKKMRAQLTQWRTQVGDPGVSEEFRAGGWPSKYPTRSLQEWQDILAQWEEHVLRNGPTPKVSGTNVWARQENQKEIMNNSLSPKRP